MTKPTASPFLKLIFHIFKTFGVASMKINSNFHFEASKLGIAYNVLLTILVLISIYFGVVVCYFVDWAKRIQLEKIADTTHTLILSITSLFILIIHCIRQQAIVNIANELRRTIEVSSSLCYKKTYEEKLHSVLRELKLIIFLNVITTSFWIISMPTYPVMICLYFVSVAICYFIVNTLMMQYTIVMTLITHLFDVLNTSLMEITISKAEDLEISFMQKFGLQTKLKKLSHCRDFFTSLTRLSRKISVFMDIIILACIFNVFVTLIMYSYYTIKPFIIVEKNLIPISLIVHNVVQLAFSMITMILLARAGSLAANQVLMPIKFRTIKRYTTALNSLSNKSLLIFTKF